MQADQRQANPVQVVGIVGGIASGKSLVCRELAALGAVVLDADKLGHAVLEEPAVRDVLRERWGDAILDEAGRVDRPRVGRIVFGPPPEGPRERRFLESVTHPRISQRISDRLAEIRVAAQESSVGPVVVVLDAALLIEAGWRRWCDEVLFVECPDAVRRTRALARGWTEEAWRAREAVQRPLEEKRQVCTGTLDNSGSSAETRRQVEDFWRRLTGVRPASADDSSRR